ncbi:MAG: LacI family DNA-binding transcriptional regulator [Chloroflexota bacterium]
MAKHRQERPVGIRDVASRAGVSPATASRALNGAVTVSDPLRVRVLEAASSLGYRPNNLARSLRRQRTDTIGVVVSDIANPHHSEAVRVMEDTASQAGWRLVLCNTDEQVHKQRAYLRLLAGRARGRGHRVGGRRGRQRHRRAARPGHPGGRLRPGHRRPSGGRGHLRQRGGGAAAHEPSARPRASPGRVRGRPAGRRDRLGAAGGLSGRHARGGAPAHGRGRRLPRGPRRACDAPAPGTRAPSDGAGRGQQHDGRGRAARGPRGRAGGPP